MNRFEIEGQIEMLIAQRDQALKGEAVTFGKLKAAEAKLEKLRRMIDELQKRLQRKPEGNDNAGTDRKSD